MRRLGVRAWLSLVLVAGLIVVSLVVRQRLADPPLPVDLVGRLVFVSDRAGREALYERRLPHGEPGLLAVLPDSARDPALSPDASRVAFSMNGRAAVLVLASGELRVLSLGVSRRDLTPAWRPDGRALVVASVAQGAATADLHLLSLEPPAPNAPLRAEAPRQVLTETPGLDESEPCFGPDGSFVVFVRQDNLVRLDLQDGKQRRLTGGFRKVHHPRFAPSGRLLALWKQDKQFGLDVMDALGQGRETLSVGTRAYSGLVPSPDGRYLAATFEYDLRFDVWALLKLRPTRELHLLDARGEPLSVLERSRVHTNHSAAWGP